MIVKFRTNLGSRDAETHGLDFRSCCEGMEVNISNKAGESLTRKGFAVEVLPTEIKAIPDKPSIGEAAAIDIKPEQKTTRGVAKKSVSNQKDE